jgi:hypothetical protein
MMNLKKTDCEDRRCVQQAQDIVRVIPATINQTAVG